MQLFYLPEACEGVVTLPEDESKHCVKVLRMAVGGRFAVTDGKGYLYDAELIDDHPKRAAAQLTNKRHGYDHWNYEVRIAVAPTKLNERMEWFLEKAVEIGIDRVSLFTSFHSERRTVNVSRFEKIMVSAMKQSLKSRLPQIDDVVPFEKLVSQPFVGQKFIAWIDDGVGECLSDMYHKSGNAFVLIGPEGDFSREEVELAKQNGFVPVSLGEARLRTETAALVALHTIRLINQMK